MTALRPLQGIRVADFCWIGAGSFSTKMLADAGADVIKIESEERLDSVRLAPPFKDGKTGVNRSGYFSDRNTSKRGVTLNLKTEEARKVALEIIRQSDIVANNFTPGVMERLGLGYDVVREIRPDIIYLSMSMQGPDGPHSSYLGYGLTISALAGLFELCGLPDRVAAGTGTNYPDHLPNPCHAVFAVLAALRHRRRTGEGQRIDVAQTEPTIALLSSAVLDYTVNGNVARRSGNDSPRFAPHGVYPAAGDDRWIAIVVTSDAQWQHLAAAFGQPAWMGEARWRTMEGRLAGREELNRLLAGETAGHDPQALMALLQRHGVPAGAVEDARDLVRDDPQLRHRGHWTELVHPEMGPSLYNAPPYRMSKSDISLRSAAPLLGQHTDEVLSSLVGLSDDEIDTLRKAGALR